MDANREVDKQDDESLMSGVSLSPVFNKYIYFGGFERF